MANIDEESGHLEQAVPKHRESDQLGERREQLDAAPSKTGGAIGAKLGIHQEWAIELEVFTEGDSEVRSPVSDDDQLGSPRPNVAYLVAQLRDLLAAKQSTKVTEEDQHDRTFFP